MKINFPIIFITIVLICSTWSCENVPEIELTVNTEEISVPSEGGTFVVSVNSNTASKATIEYENSTETGWIFLLPSVLKGDGYLEVRVSSYDEMWTNRTANIVVTTEDVTRVITITQTSKAELLVTPSTILATGDEDNVYTLTVACKSSWTASVDKEASSWCTLTNSSGEGGKEETITIFVAKNTETQDRKATITVSGNNMTRTSDVLQSFINHSDEGIVINGLLWAKYNVGEPGMFTSDFDKRGLLYQYDSNIGWLNSSPNESNKPTGYPTGQWDVGHEWLHVNSPCPDGWRIPTADEIETLIGKNSKYYYFFDGNGSGPSFEAGFACAGAVVGIPASEAALATKNNMRGGIFIPQTGYRDGNTGKQDNWWDASLSSITQPGQSWDRIVFWINYAQDSGNYSAGNAAAYPIRCVKDIH